MSKPEDDKWKELFYETLPYALQLANEGMGINELREKVRLHIRELNAGKNAIRREEAKKTGKSFEQSPQHASVEHEKELDVKVTTVLFDYSTFPPTQIDPKTNQPL